MKGGGGGMVLYNAPGDLFPETSDTHLRADHPHRGRRRPPCLPDGSTLAPRPRSHRCQRPPATATSCRPSRHAVRAGLTIKPDITAPGLQILAGNTPMPEDAERWPCRATSTGSSAAPRWRSRTWPDRRSSCMRRTPTGRRARSAPRSTDSASTTVLRQGRPGDAVRHGPAGSTVNVAGFPGLLFDETAHATWRGLGNARPTAVHLNIAQASAPVDARDGATTTAPSPTPGAPATVQRRHPVGVRRSSMTPSRRRSRSATGRVAGDRDHPRSGRRRHQSSATSSWPPRAAIGTASAGGVPVTPERDRHDGAGCTPDPVDVPRPRPAPRTGRTTPTPTPSSTAGRGRRRRHGDRGRTSASPPAARVATAGKRRPRRHTQACPPSPPGRSSDTSRWTVSATRPYRHRRRAHRELQHPVVRLRRARVRPHRGSTPTATSSSGAASDADNVCFTPATHEPGTPDNVLAPFWTDLDGTGAPGIFAAILTERPQQLDRRRVAGERVRHHSQRVFQTWIGINGTEDITFAYPPGNIPSYPGSTYGLTIGAENSSGEGTSTVAPNTAPPGDLRVTTGADTPSGTVRVGRHRPGHGRGHGVDRGRGHVGRPPRHRRRRQRARGRPRAAAGGHRRPRRPHRRRPRHGHLHRRRHRRHVRPLGAPAGWGRALGDRPRGDHDHPVVHRPRRRRRQPVPRRVRQHHRGRGPDRRGHADGRPARHDHRGVGRPGQPGARPGRHPHRRDQPGDGERRRAVRRRRHRRGRPGHRHRRHGHQPGRARHRRRGPHRDRDLRRRRRPRPVGRRRRPQRRPQRLDDDDRGDHLGRDRRGHTGRGHHHRHPGADGRHRRAHRRRHALRLAADARRHRHGRDDADRPRPRVPHDRRPLHRRRRPRPLRGRRHHHRLPGRGGLRPPGVPGGAGSQRRRDGHRLLGRPHRGRPGPDDAHRSLRGLGRGPQPARGAGLPHRPGPAVDGVRPGVLVGPGGRWHDRRGSPGHPAGVTRGGAERGRDRRGLRREALRRPPGADAHGGRGRVLGRPGRGDAEPGPAARAWSSSSAAWPRPPRSPCRRRPASCAAPPPSRPGSPSSSGPGGSPSAATRSASPATPSPSSAPAAAPRPCDRAGPRPQVGSVSRKAKVALVRWYATRGATHRAS